MILSEELEASLARIDELKQQIDELRPTLTPDVLARVFQKFRLDWNYHSNSIEGNSLTFGETVAFLMEGVTAKGKPLKDHLDLRGHNEAIDFLQALVKDDRGITEAEIRELHKMILVEPYEVKAQTADGRPTTKTIQLGQYKTSPNHVETRTGAIHYYATPEETPAKMQELMMWYRENRDTLHPLVLAALFHHKFVAIHPFDDGNGRMTRLLTNLLLMQTGFPVIVIKTEEKSAYYGVLSQADAGVTAPLLEFFVERLIRSLEIYLRGVRGEDITEPDDIDKEIALLKASADAKRQIVKPPLSAEISAAFVRNTWAELLQELDEGTAKLNDLFLKINLEIELTTTKLTRESHTKGATKPLSEWFDKADALFMQGEKLRALTAYITFDGYQGGAPEDAPFNVRADLGITFDQYQYQIKIQNTSFSRSRIYATIPPPNEYKEIVNAILRKVIDEIKQQSPPA
jgi:Fic family protein